MHPASFSIINYQFDEVYINLHNYKEALNRKDFKIVYPEEYAEGYVV